MKLREATVIPYERQSDPQTTRMCGAACLSMVYRSFGKEVPQTEIWPAIAKPNRFGSVSSTTHLMAQDALNRGFGAVAIQARRPLQVLRLCRDFGLRAILNHRLRGDVPTGHYSVMVDINDNDVVLHDPLLGPSRRLTLVELLELWLPYRADSEIVGNVLIAVGAQGATPVEACELCGTSIPLNVECPRCKKPVDLQPGAVLGCIKDACIARMWNCICCPICDCVLTFSLQPPHAGAPAGILAASRTATPDTKGASSSPAALDVNKLFGEMDKFCAHVLGIPAAANHPEIKKQLDYLAASKEKFKLAYTEQLARGTMLKAQFAALTKAAKEQEETHLKKIEELNTPSPPLDGDALGRALLKNLGLTD
jgi:Papain-like cysteine protease AvrRpt2